MTTEPSSTTNASSAKETPTTVTGETTLSPSSSPVLTSVVPDTTTTIESSITTAEPPATQTQGRTQSDIEEQPLDPRLAPLKAMFPDFDDTLLLSVLESVRGNQDRAVDTLLGMSDPEYKSDSRPQEAEPAEERVLSQTEMDEQFARQLYLQDEQRIQQQRQEWEAQRPRPARQSSQNNGTEKDVMTEVSEQFRSIAETGRKTFGNIFSKVKAKMSEFDQQRQQQQGQSSQSAYYEPNQGVQTQYPNNRQYQAYQTSAEQPSFYDPNPQSSSTSPTTVAPTSHENAVPANKEPQGYDVSPSPADTPKPPTTGSGSGTAIDGAKLGLLPKRPVSLLVQSPPPSQAKREDDDELEYVENPFEESSGRK